MKTLALVLFLLMYVLMIFLPKYRPLYALGDTCGGAFRYSASGVKVCTDCTLLHVGDAGAAIVKERFPELKELARRRTTTL